MIFFVPPEKRMNVIFALKSSQGKSEIVTSPNMALRAGKLNKAIVLAGGRGERLKSKVSHLPKPMASVHGRPFLEYVLYGLAASSITDVILSVGFGATIIRDHFGNHYRNLNLRYSEDTTPLGTGGAIAFALLGEDTSPVLVLNGDSLLELNYQAFFSWYMADPSPIAMVLRQVPDVSRYGTAILSADRVVEFREKGSTGPGLVNAGIYIIRPTFFSQYQFGENFSFETQVLQQHCRDIRLRAFIAPGYFIDIGTPEDYDRAQKELRDFWITHAH